MVASPALGSRRFRSALSATLLTLAALSLLVGSLGLYAWATVVSSDGFADRVDRLRADPAVQREFSNVVATKIIDAAPTLVSVRPLLEQIAAGVVASDAAAPVIRSAARNLHAAVLNPSQDNVVFDLADLGVVVAAALRAVDPRLAERVPAHVQAALVTVSERGVETNLPRTAQQIKWLAVAGLAGAALLIAAAVAAAPQRRTAVAGAGLAVAGAAVALAIVVFAIRAWITMRADPDHEDVARAVWGVFVRPLLGWAAALALLGAVVTATATVARRIDLAAIAGRVAAAVRWSGQTRGRRAARGLVLIGAGVLTAVQPLAVLTTLAVAGGFVVVVYGLTELADVARSRAVHTDTGQEPASQPQPRSIFARAAIPGLAAVLIVAIAVTVAARELRTAPLATVEDEGPLRCNGFAQLCDRTLDTVALAATHNSMSASLEPGWYLAEQHGGIVAQLDYGVRGLLIDTHYGRNAGDGSVRTDQSSFAEARGALQAEFGEPAVAAAERLAARGGFGGGTGPRRSFLCHNLCEFGATSLDTALSGIDAWLTAHPNEVLVLFIQDAITPADTAAAFERTGLIRRVYTPPQPGATTTWPTLREMIQHDTRVVVLAEKTAGGSAYPWYQDGFAVAQETNYNVRSVGAFHCAPNRGGTAGSLFLLNHWLAGSPRPIQAAEKVNARDLLLPRAQECEHEREHIPNLIAVNFYDRGALLDVVNALNGVSQQTGP